MKTLVFTCGDVNGIGPEIVIKSINKFFNPQKRKIIFICPANAFEQCSKNTLPIFPFNISKKIILSEEFPEKVQILDIGNTEVNLGKPTISSGKTAARAIEKSVEVHSIIKESVVITAPISKTAFEMAGVNFPGQTEYYSSLTKSSSYLMTFLSKSLICGLVTIHEPISSISKLLNKSRVENAVHQMLKMIKIDLNIKNPRLAVLGLNPHSGENGRIGTEELRTIIPALKKFDKENVQGPFVPDAFFGTMLYKKFNAVLGMYHDQVLIPFKLLNFNSGVNFTAGLPIIRTSPDHGTAFDIAGKGIADPSSMISSIQWAERILSNRLRNNVR